MEQMESILPFALLPRNSTGVNCAITQVYETWQIDLFWSSLILLCICWHPTPQQNAVLKIQFPPGWYKNTNTWCKNTIYTTGLQPINPFPSNRKSNLCENTLQPSQITEFCKHLQSQARCWANKKDTEWGLSMGGGWDTTTWLEKQPFNCQLYNTSKYQINTNSPTVIERKIVGVKTNQY